MRLSIVFAAVLASFATTAAAQDDIRWMPETMTPGDFVTIDQSVGGLIHHVFSGSSGSEFVIHSFRGAAPGGTPVFTTYLDRDGNSTRWVRADGFEIVYEPHDCTRTLGRCQYTQISSDGSSEVRLRITEATDRGFTFDEYDANGQRIFGGWIELDDRGMAGDGRISGNDGRQRFRLVSTFYQ